MSTLGFSMSVGAGAAGAVPPVGDVGIFLDVTAGSDAAGGTSWADAYLTWEKALAALEGILDSHPNDIDITIWVRNGTGGAVPAGSYCVSPHVSDRVRVHVVNPVGTWLTINGPGTVPIGGSTAEPGSGLAIVVMAAPMVVAATDQGLFLQLVHGTEVVLTTILAVDTVGNAYVVSMTDAAMPAWVDAAGDTIATVLEPDTVVNGDFTFAPVAASVGNFTTPIDNVYSPRCWAFGIRADNFNMGGSESAFAGCIAHSAGAQVPDGDIWLAGTTGVMGVWSYSLQGGIPQYISPTRAASWGLVGTTPALGQACGGSCSNVNVISAEANVWCGSALQNFTARYNCHVFGTRFMAEDVFVQNGAHAELSDFRAIGEAGVSAVTAQHEGSDCEVGAFMLVGLAQGQRAWFESLQNAQIRIVDAGDLAKQAAAPADYPVWGLYANGGRIVVEAGGVPDEIRAQRETIWADAQGEIDITGDVEVTTARPGGGTSDIHASHNSRINIVGEMVKGAYNTVASAFIDVEHGSTLVQTGGGIAMVAPDNWTTRYGALGFIHVADYSNMTCGSIADDGVGAGAGIAVQVRRFSSLWNGGNCQITNVAGNTTKIGSAAAAPFPAAVLNDLPAAPAGTEELCVIGPTASP